MIRQVTFGFLISMMSSCCCCNSLHVCLCCNFTDGIFLPDIVKYARLCRKAKEREYRYQQKLYYGRLLRELLVNRQVSGTYCLVTRHTCKQLAQNFLYYSQMSGIFKT